MPHPTNRIKGTCLVAIGSLGIATMAVAAPFNTPAYRLPPQERPVQESSTEKQQVPPDNSKKNKRDRDEKNLTPLDQGGSAEDRKITQDIRKEINKNKDISTNGKNVKIITIDSVVTLRGPVASAGEKQLINDIAGKIAGPTKVKNHLEVK